MRSRMVWRNSGLLLYEDEIRSVEGPDARRGGPEALRFGFLRLIAVNSSNKNGPLVSTPEFPFWLGRLTRRARP